MHSIVQLLLIFLFVSSNLQSETIAIIADSIGRGVQGEKPYPDLIEEHYNEVLGKKFTFIKDCKGSTLISSGYNRLAKILESHSPDFLIYTLGINDCLSRKTPIKELYNDLYDTLELANNNDVEVLLGTIDATAYDYIIHDANYERKFEEVYIRLYKNFGVNLFPFLYKDLIEDPSLTYDKFHLNELGQKIISDIIIEKLDTLLDE